MHFHFCADEARMLVAALGSIPAALLGVRVWWLRRRSRPEAR